MVFEWGPGTRRVGYPLWHPGLSCCAQLPGQQEAIGKSVLHLILSVWSSAPCLRLGLGTCMWMELQFSGQWVGEQVADQVVGAQ